ncbi:MAG: hypothetical protein AB7F22_07905 [Reyranella sp.]|uniref:hypothetical protein n=1 Tax=Reyranella sp. TaxID=1929291 RepID=UPI003D0FF348
MISKIKPRWLRRIVVVTFGVLLGIVFILAAAIAAAFDQALEMSKTIIRDLRRVWGLK